MTKTACNENYECLSGLCNGGFCKEQITETLCSDGVDNDCDLNVDCADPECASQCCGSEGNECCTVGDDCTGSLYCDDTHCCFPGEFWNGAFCQEGESECGLGGTQASDGVCYVDAGDDLLGWIADPDCYPPASSLGCCETFKYGQTGYYETDITTY